MKNDIIWNSIGTAAWSFLSLFLLIIVTRINGIEDSGLFSFAFALAVIMFTVACYGGRAYQVSDHKNAFSIDAYISLRIATSFIVILVTLLFIAINDYDWYKALLILLLVSQRIFDAIADVFYGILQKKHRLYISGKSLFYKSLLSLIVFVSVDILTENLLLSALTLPIISLLFILFYDVPQSRNIENFSTKPNYKEVRGMLKSTFLPFSIAVMGLIFVNLARYFIDLYHPNLQGHFGIIIMPLSLIILLFSFISTPAILALSDMYNTGNFKSLNRTTSKIALLIIVATLLFSVLTYAFGTQILHLLFNVDFTEYTYDIVLVVLIGLAISLTSLFTNVAIIARKLKLTVILYFSSLILLAVLCLSLIPQYQIRGAILAYIIASTVQAIVMGLYYLYLTMGYKRSKNL